VAESDASAVAHYDSLSHEVVISGLRILHLSEEEVGISRIYLLADRQEREGIHELTALLKDKLHPLLHLKVAVETVKSLLLCQFVDVIRIFHLIIYRDAAECYVQAFRSIH